MGVPTSTTCLSALQMATSPWHQPTSPSQTLLFHLQHLKLPTATAQQRLSQSLASLWAFPSSCAVQMACKPPSPTMSEATVACWTTSGSSPPG